MARLFRPRPVKLDDCSRYGADSELFVVEGDSAALAVSRVRDPLTQAVLPMQGKPLNALKATEKRLAAQPLFTALTESLGAGCGDDRRLYDAR